MLGLVIWFLARVCIDGYYLEVVGSNYEAVVKDLDSRSQQVMEVKVAQRFGMFVMKKS